MLDVSFVIFSIVIIDLKYVFVSSPGFHEGGEATISGSFVPDDGGDGLKGAAGLLHHFQNQETKIDFLSVKRLSNTAKTDVKSNNIAKSLQIKS